MIEDLYFPRNCVFHVLQLFCRLTSVFLKETKSYPFIISHSHSHLTEFQILGFSFLIFTFNLKWNEYSFPRIQIVRMEGKRTGIDIPMNGKSKVLNPALSAFFLQLPHKLQHCLKSQLKRLAKDGDRIKSVNSVLEKKNGSSDGLQIDLEKQLEIWRENPSWVNPPPEIEVKRYWDTILQRLQTYGNLGEMKITHIRHIHVSDTHIRIRVSVARGSLCYLKATADVGLPPDAVYDIVTDPDNRRVFKNIKEVISRKILIDEGQRQVVEVEQAALWRFLWWSGTIPVHVLVDQNREDHSMRFKQMNNGFMKKFEGYWRVEPVFVDEKTCFPFKPKTLTEYCSCTGGKGRIGSKVSLDQLIQPAIAPPPPISWYLSGIPAKTTEMLINDLLAEAARLKGGCDSEISNEELQSSKEISEHYRHLEQVCDIKERWKLRRRLARRKKLSTDESSSF